MTTDQNASEMARALAARRPRATYTCEVCGESFEAIVRRTKRPDAPREPRLCSTRCKQRRKAQRARAAQRLTSAP